MLGINVKTKQLKYIKNKGKNNYNQTGLKCLKNVRVFSNGATDLNIVF